MFGYRGGCRFCGGRGCLACQGERDRQARKNREAAEQETALKRRIIEGTLTEGDQGALGLMKAVWQMAPVTERGLFTLAEANAAVAERVAAGEDEQAVRDRIAPYLKLPPPTMTIRFDDPAGMGMLRQTLGREALERAFGPGGGGAEEIARNIEDALRDHPQARGWGDTPPEDG